MTWLASRPTLRTSPSLPSRARGIQVRFRGSDLEHPVVLHRHQGTARWLEHQLDIDGSAHHAGSPGEFLFGDAAGVYGTKEHFGFGRWNTTGAAFMTVAERLSIDDVAQRVEAGESSAAVVFGVLGTGDAIAEEFLS